MGKYGKWVVLLIIAGVLWAGLAQISASMNGSHRASVEDAQMTTVPGQSGGSSAAEDPGDSSACPVMKQMQGASPATADDTAATDHAKTGVCPAMKGMPSEGMPSGDSVDTTKGTCPYAGTSGQDMSSQSASTQACPVTGTGKAGAESMQPQNSPATKTAKTTEGTSDSQ